MMTAIVLAVTVIGTAGFVIWPIWQGTRRPWALQVPSGDEEALRQEQALALETLRDLAMDFKLGNLSQADYRALAVPLQERTKRTLALQAQQRRNQDMARRHAQPDMAELDPLLEARIQAARRVPAAVAPAGGAAAYYCPQCGIPAAAEYRFCTACGARLPAGRPARHTGEELGANGGIIAVKELARVPAGVAGQEPEQLAMEPEEQIPVPSIAPGSGTSGAADSAQSALPLAVRRSPRWLWAAGLITFVWLAGIIWLYQGSRSSQQNQVPIASLPDVPVQSLAATGSGLVLGEAKGVRVSADGRNWVPLPVAGDIRAVISLDGEGRLWLAAGPAGLWRSQDGANSWQPVETTPADLAPLTLAAAPGAPEVLWATDTSRLYTSRDGGLHWSGVDNPLPGRPRALVAGALDLFLGTDQGVFRSSNDGRSWASYNGSVNGAIISTDVWALAYDEGNGLLYAGTPAGLSFQKLDAPGSWGRRPLQADVTALALGGDNAQELWVGTRAGQIYRSRDRGVTWR